MLELVLGAVGTAVIAFFAYQWLLPTPQEKEALWRLLTKRFQASSRPVPIEPTLQPAPPLPPPPEPEIGNVRPNKAEWGQLSDLTQAYSFPSRPPPVTRYEDLNRRLFVFTEAAKPLPNAKLPLRAIDDHATAITCSAGGLAKAVQVELRCAYPVIIDRAGWFASASRTLEHNPNAANALVDIYLRIPEERRPVIVSFAVGDKSQNAFTLCRHQFEDLRFETRFLTPYLEQSFSYLLEQFLQERTTWLWFSAARLRAHVANLNKAPEEARARLESVLQTNNFALLWNLRLEPQLTANTPHETQGSSESGEPADPSTKESHEAAP